MLGAELPMQAGGFAVQRRGILRAYAAQETMIDALVTALHARAAPLRTADGRPRRPAGEDLYLAFLVTALARRREAGGA